MIIKSKSENVLCSLHEIEPEALVTMIDHPKLAKTSRYANLHLRLKTQKFVLIKESYWETQGTVVVLLHQNKLMGWGVF